MVRKILKIRSNKVKQEDIDLFEYQISGYGRDQLVFFDATHTMRWDCNRTHGYAERGARAEAPGFKQRGRKSKFHILALISSQQYLTPHIFQDSLNVDKMLHLIPAIVRAVSGFGVGLFPFSICLFPLSVLVSSEAP